MFLIKQQVINLLSIISNQKSYIQKKSPRSIVQWNEAIYEIIGSGTGN